MTVSAILDEVRRCGAVLYRTGNCLRLRPASAIPADLVAALRAHKTALLRLVPEGTPATPSTPAATREVSGALRIASRTLGEDVWLVADDEDAAVLEAELADEGDTHLVFTPRGGAGAPRHARRGHAESRPRQAPVPWEPDRRRDAAASGGAVMALALFFESSADGGGEEPV